MYRSALKSFSLSIFQKWRIFRPNISFVMILKSKGSLQSTLGAKNVDNEFVISPKSLFSLTNTFASTIWMDFSRNPVSPVESHPEMKQLPCYALHVMHLLAITLKISWNWKPRFISQPLVSFSPAFVLVSLYNRKINLFFLPFPKSTYIKQKGNRSVLFSEDTIASRRIE